MKAVRTRSFLCALLLGAVALSTTGCLSGIKEPYSLEERIPVMEDSLSRTVRYADGFASDLCVVEDEGSFDENYVTSEQLPFLMSATGKHSTARKPLNGCIRPVSPRL